MKKIFSLFLVFGLCFSLVGCGGSKKDIKGTWESTMTGTTFTLDDDTMKFDDGSGGNYKYDEDANTLTLIDGSGSSKKMKAVLEDDRLTLTVDTGEVIFTRKK